MAYSGLPTKMVDVFLSFLNQTPGKHQGPIGQLTSAKDTLVTKYDTSNGPKFKLGARGGFSATPTALRKTSDGSSSSAGWAAPGLATGFGDQLVSIANGIPRVKADQSYASYDNDRVVTNNLTSDVVTTTNHVLNIPSSAQIQDVECFVWVESTASDSTTPMAGFRTLDKTWIRTPFALDANTYGNAHNGRCSVKVVADGNRFWVCVAQIQSGGPRILVMLFDRLGNYVATVTVTASDTHNPNIFDLKYLENADAVVLAYADGTGGTNLATLSFSGSMSVSITNVPSIVCSTGQLGFLEQDPDDGDDHGYLATVTPGPDSAKIVKAYQITPTSRTHTFDVDYLIGTNSEFIDSLTGYVTGGPDDPVVHVEIARLSAGGVDSGPEFDPALRYTDLWQCGMIGTGSAEKSFHSTIPNARPFKLGNDWHSINYYQSGTGLNSAQDPIDISHTPGDYFIGENVQSIPVIDGDFVIGSPITQSGNGIHTTSSAGSTGLSSPDEVAVVYHPEDGQPLFRWKISGLTMTALMTHGRLVVSGVATTSVNGTWDIAIDFGNGYFYTLPYAADGHTIVWPPGLSITLAAGSASVASTTYYEFEALGDFVTPDVAFFFVGGTVTSAGNPTGGNNGTFTIVRLIVQNRFQNPAYGASRPCAVVDTTTQSTNISGFTGTVSAANANRWVLTTSGDNSSLVGGTLSAFGTDYEITAAGLNYIDTGNAQGILSRYFHEPLPTVTARIPNAAQPLSVYLQSASTGSSWLGGYLLIADADHPINNGIYRIDQIDPDNDNIIWLTSGQTGQVNDTLSSATVTVILPVAQQFPFQATWIMQPLSAAPALTGAFESGIAFADWRTESDTSFPTRYPFCLSNVSYIAETGDDLPIHRVSLPYRAESVTATTLFSTANGQAPISNVQLGGNSQVSTIGIKEFAIENEIGVSIAAQESLLCPGPLAVEFSGSEWRENNFIVGPEQPWLVSQSTSDPDVLGLTPNQPYQYIPVFEYTDQTGQRSFSRLGPALNIKLTNDANQATISGRLPVPLGTSGALANGVAGLSDKLIGISIYRTSVIGTGNDTVPTTIHYKITNDLNINGLSPVSASNPSGFSFPDQFTWEYLDSNPDVIVSASETLYTDKGFVQRYPAPSNRFGVDWLNRTWVIGYDNAVWFSGEHTTGDSTWFHPAFRLQLPSQERITALGKLDSMLVVFTDSGIWYVPAAENLPDGSGQGKIPSPRQTDYRNGCTGRAVTIPGAVAYASTAGGVWAFTPGFENIWLSEQVKDSLIGNILSMSVDGNQRLHVTTDGVWFMYDAAITKTWHEWQLSYLGPRIGSTWKGNPILQTEECVFVYDSGAVVDTNSDGDEFAIAPDVEFQCIDWGTVRGLKRVYEFQAIGTYHGRHFVNVVASYPETEEDDTEFEPIEQDGSRPWIVVFNPMVEETSSFVVRIYASFEGLENPGASFELELMSAEVGYDSRSGLNKLPDAYRTKATR